MKDIHENIAYFLEEEANLEENFLILEEDTKISDYKYYLLLIMYLISKTN